MMAACLGTREAAATTNSHMKDANRKKILLSSSKHNSLAHDKMCLM